MSGFSAFGRLDDEGVQYLGRRGAGQGCARGTVPLLAKLPAPLYRAAAGLTTLLFACGGSEPRAGSAAPGVPSAIGSSGASILGIAIHPGMQTLMEPRRLSGDSTRDMFDSAYKSTDKPEKGAAFYREALGMSGRGCPGFRRHARPGQP